MAFLRSLGTAICAATLCLASIARVAPAQTTILEPRTETIVRQGILAHAQNDPERAIGMLAPIIDTLRTLAQSEWVAGVDALAESYRAVYRYREAAETYRSALSQATGKPRIALDSAIRTRWQQQRTFTEALRDVLPQSVTWHTTASRDTIANGGIEYAVRVRIGEKDVPRPLRVDLGVTVTMLDSTTAASSGVRLRKDTLLIATNDGTIATAHIGIVPSLEIGPASVSNVIVLVLDARVLSALTDSLDSTRAISPVAGVIGLPVLNALGRVTLTADGHVALTSPGVRLASSENARDTMTSEIRVTFESLSDSGPIERAHAGSFPFAVIPMGIVRSSGVDRRMTPLGTDPVRTVQALVSSAALTTSTTDTTFLHKNRDAGANPSIQSITLDFSTMRLTVQRSQPPPVLPTITYPDATPLASHETPTPIPEDLAFVALLFALFVIPKALQRYRIPSAITSLVMGALASQLGLFPHDPTLHLLSTFGIVALFLFAGLEIDGRALRHQASALMTHGLVWTGLVVVTAGIAVLGFGVAIRPALLIGLALMTPSTGFILSSLTGFGLHESEQVAVKTYAIGSELLALGILFFVVQSTSAEQLAFSLAAMIGVVVVIPLAFRFFAAVVAPHAPRSEFAFLLMVAVVCAYATRRLGVYYLVGAFLVGIAAQRFRVDHPAMSSERMVNALESFGSVFIPFYFFYAGTQIASDQITLAAIGIGILLVVICIPVRIGVIVLQRKYSLGESFLGARRIGSTLIPTLVFTLVLADILHTQFALADTIVGALVLYTVLNTSLPAFLLHGTPPEFEHVEASAAE